MAMESIEPVTQEVLFLGTGIMGAPMARRLGGAGNSVVAWNRTAHKAAGLAGAGVRTVQDLRDLSVKPRIVVVMLSTGEVVDQVLFGAAPRGTPPFFMRQHALRAIATARD
jgi:2-hydroxy-3-oxopropionate reductase